MDYVDRFAEFLRAIWREEQFEFIKEGFVAGLALGLVLIFLVLLMLLFLRSRRRCAGVTIQSEYGELHVTVNAMREFVTRILCEFQEASMRSIYLRRSGGNLILTIVLDAVPDTDLVSLQDRVSRRVIAEAAEKIGTQGLLQRVNVTVRSYTAEQSKIVRQARKFGVTKPSGSISVPELPELQ
ncbi:MAG: hypothetical protein A3K19_12330 [Lentisphaerae bacterium RIFOXYB12_FULL_65_16]|nr:MAG: hypothetical protein A3K18_01895 [Lentisphaerae bacterium RIFOXYA12_64_32]OGV86116.1 MAG: hypothetical protein A3K19_12330 [Lentisphaerae bacterium RIFOXYB12_FULL_65_16]